MRGGTTTLRRLKFGDHKAAYGHVPAWKLMKSLAIRRLCRIPVVSQNSVQILHSMSRVLGDTVVYDFLVKYSMFNHFCAGEDERGIKKTLSFLAAQNIGSILDYAAEADVPIVKHDSPPDISMPTLVTKTSLKYEQDEELYDANMKLYVLCVAHASLNSWQYGVGYAAVKLTGLMDPQLLARVNAILLYIRQQWVRLFTPDDTTVPPLEECRVVLGNHMKESLHAASYETVRAGLKKWCENDISDAQIDGILSLLDPKSTGSVEYLDYTRTLARALNNEDPTMVKMAPLLKHCPQLTPLEAMLWAKGKRRVRTICQVAAELGVHVMIDAEQTFYQMAIDHVVRNLQREFNKEAPVIFNTYQCYMKIAPQRLRNDIDRAKREGWVWAGKIVRGAYLVQERSTAAEYNYVSPIHEEKEHTDECYDKVAMDILRELEADPSNKLGALFGTHNQESIEKITKTVVEKDLNASRLSFAQLLGMADHLTVPLARAGFHTFKYVPYGPVKETIQYLSRRAQENSSILSGTGADEKMQWAELRRRVRL